MNPHQRAAKALLPRLALIFLVVSLSRCVFGQTGQEQTSRCCESSGRLNVV
jgi:hypothetical protein